jgi:hypothetical protein
VPSGLNLAPLSTLGALQPAPASGATGSEGVPGAQAQQTPNGPFIAAGTCFYWLHTHAPDGIIHIESPVQRIYTLGEFFDEWGQPLGPAQVGPVTGRVVALYDGKVYQGNPRDIPLTAHAQIQLDVGTPLIGPAAGDLPRRAMTSSRHASLYPCLTTARAPAG